MAEGTRTVAAPSGPRIIERPRLTKILDESDARIILLVAPAGYGKTTLARQWLSDKPHVWYQATPASADPVALTVGLARTFGADSGAVAAVLAANRSLAEIPTALADLLQRSLDATPFVVIDDYHFIAETPTSEELIGEIFRRLRGVGLITTRRSPCWCTARDVVYGRVTEIDAAALRMTDDEAARVLPLTPNGREVALRAHGWPALVALAAAGSDVAAPRSDDPDHIFRFFAEELLRGVPPEIEAWLTDSAVASSLLTSCAVPANHLDDCVRRGFLVVGSDGPVMHPLVRMFLTDRLRRSPDSVEQTCRLAERLAQEGNAAEAFEVIVEFGHAQLLDDFFRSHVPRLLRSGLVETARRWARRARALRYTGPALDLIEADELERKGAFSDAHDLSRAVAERVETNDTLRTVALLMVGRTAYMTDHLIGAAAAYEAASESARSPADRVEALFGAFTALAELEDTRAANTLERLRATDVTTDPAAALRVAVAEMHYAVFHGAVSTGLAAAAAVEASAVAVRDPRITSAFLSMYSLLLADRGNYAAASPYAEAARARAQEARLDFACAHIDLRYAIACIGSARYSEASRLVMRSLTYARSASDTYLEHICATTRMKLFLAQGLAAEAVAVPVVPRPTAAAFNAESSAVRGAAAAMVGERERALELAEVAEATSSANIAKVAAAAARALAESGAEDESIAFETLLTTVEAFGNVEFAVTCLRGCAPFAECLRRFAAPSHLRGVRDELLRLAHPTTAGRAGHQTSGSQLSPREREVLLLVGQGLTNKAIARALFISDVTVKVHLRHIYEKLGVRGRTEAALVARDLDLEGIADAT